MVAVLEMTATRRNWPLAACSPEPITGPNGSPDVDPDGTHERGEVQAISPDEAEHPFKPGDALQFRTGGRTYRFLRNAPGRPGFIVCEFWEPASYGSFRLERIEVRFPADRMQLIDADDTHR